jgi:lysophospholipase L1-like esterase
MRLPRLILFALLVLGFTLLGLPSAEARSKTSKKTSKSSPAKAGVKKESSAKKSSSNKSSAKKSSGKKRSGKSAKASKRKPPTRRLSPRELLASLPPVPLECPQALTPFYQSLRVLQEDPGAPGPGARVVRILHFGDSHVAADLWTGDLRALLQARFGDGGPGYVMPGRPWKYFRHSRARSLSGNGWQRCGLKDDPGTGIVGFSRVSLRPGLPSKKKMEPAGLESECRGVEIQFAAGGDWDRTVTVDGQPLSKEVLLPADAETGALPAADVPAEIPELPPVLPPIPHRCVSSPLGDSGYSLFTESNRDLLPPGSHRIEVEVSGDALLLGMDLRSGEPGVLVDALGLNGSELTDLECWGSGVRADLMRHGNPALIVVSFGTNDMGGKGFDPAVYRETCLRVLRSLRSDAPGAAILVTGPMDRGGKSKKSRGLMQDRSRAITGAMREAALQAGCAFWDGRAAMGGEGSMSRWASAGLAQRDQVHLTDPGYRQFARFLFDALIKAFDGASIPPAPSPEEAGK